MKSILLLQIMEKKNQKLNENEINLKYHKIIKDETEKFKSEKILHNEKFKKKLADYKQMLDNQIKTSKKIKANQYYGMDTTEKKLNSKLLLEPESNSDDFQDNESSSGVESS